MAECDSERMPVAPSNLAAVAASDLCIKHSVSAESQLVSVVVHVDPLLLLLGFWSCSIQCWLVAVKAPFRFWISDCSLTLYRKWVWAAAPI